MFVPLHFFVAPVMSFLIRSGQNPHKTRTAQKTQPLCLIINNNRVSKGLGVTWPQGQRQTWVFLT